MKKLKTKDIVVVALLFAIMMILNWTPLGMIPIGPISATTIHIPVVIGSIVFGYKIGGVLGLLFGLISFFNALTSPTAASFIFINPLISIIPRIFVGIIPGLAFQGLKKIENKIDNKFMYIFWVILFIILSILIGKNIKNGESIFVLLIFLLVLITVSVMSIRRKDKEYFFVSLASALGAIVNTVLVLSMIYIIYGKEYAELLGQAKDLAFKLIASIAVVNGFPEMIAVIAIATPICIQLFKQER